VLLAGLLAVATAGATFAPFSRTTPAHYAVGAELHAASLIGTEPVGVAGRLDTSNANGAFYTARYSVTGAAWHLYRFVNNAAVPLGSYADPYTGGQTR
jgi:hypothetical protein